MQIKKKKYFIMMIVFLLVGICLLLVNAAIFGDRTKNITYYLLFIISLCLIGLWMINLAIFLIFHLKGKKYNSYYQSLADEMTSCSLKHLDFSEKQFDFISNSK
jgi:hypothetical protein